MNAYDAPSPSEMLTAFLEGDLDGSHEDLLFSLLNDDHALRIEMRELIAVNRLARYDADAMALPAAWKSAVMNGIAGAPIAGQRETVRPAPAGWYRNGRMILAALLLGILGTLGALRLIYDSGTTIASIEHVAAWPESAGDKHAGPNLLSGDRLTPELPDDKENATTPSERGVLRADVARLHGAEERPVGTVDPEGEPRHAFDSETQHDPRSPMLRTDSLERSSVITEQLADVNDLLSEHDAADRARPISSSLSTPPPPYLSVRRERLELGYRHSLGSNYPNVRIPSTASEGIGEISLSVLYRIGSGHALGLEGGRGNFPQIFRGFESGERVRYEQNPTLLWGGFAYQYTADAILLDGVHPFARLIAGGTVAGPMGRGVLGLRFVPESRMALTAGLEGSLLLYEFQNERFTSSGLDFTYGISVSF